MKYLLKFTLFTLLSFNLLFSQTTDEIYIEKYAKMAVEEMELYKIPASITLAQGLLETADGQSELARNANNHFGIKCKVEWTGETYRYTDDAYKECFRKYPSVADSYRDHSKFLAERPYYKALFSLDMYDYKAWAYGLKKAGYATNKNYAPLLINLIEKFKLYEFDKVKVHEVDTKIATLYPDLNKTIVAEKPIEVVSTKPEKPTPTKVDTILHAPKSKIHPLQRIKKHKNKKLKYVTIEQGETLNQLAKVYETSIEKLQLYNDFKSVNTIKTGENVFLQKKKSSGSTKLYKVKEGDNLYSISQQEGIQLQKLLKRNRMKKVEDLKPNQILYLQGKKKK